MDGQLVRRWQLALCGGLGAALLRVLADAVERDLLGDRPGLALLAFASSGLVAVLAMAGPIGLRRALPRALGLGLVVAVLIWLAGLRHDAPEAIFRAPLSALALLVVASLPLPFLIASARGNWRDYAALFLEAWSIVVRYAAAWAFTGLVWLVILLSDQVLQIVGVTVIASLLDVPMVPMVLTGAVLGLGMAVVFELAELVSPHLVLRLFRLLLPAVLGVTLVFLAALPLRGLEGLFNGLSPALLLLAMVAAGVSLVAITVDQSDAEASQSPILRLAAQGMALILPVLAGVAVWAIWLRVDQHGWTPERLFLALLGGLGLVYGVIYAFVILARGNWMARIRQANISMALLVILVAALWLTPVLNAERLSAQSQLARFEAGITPVADLDLWALQSWGRAGADAMARLEALALEPGQEALADRLAILAAGRGDAGGPDPAAQAMVLAQRLAAVIPVQPATATGTRDTLLGAAEAFVLEGWAEVCARSGPEGRPACLMVIGDLMPALPGEEAILFLTHSADYTEMLGLFLGEGGRLVSAPVMRSDGSYPTPEEVAGVMRDWAATPPPLTAAPINQLGTGEAGLLIRP